MATSLPPTAERPATERPATAPHPPAAPAPRPGRRPRRWRWLLAGAVVVVVLAGIAVSATASRPAAPTPAVTPTAAPRLIARGRVQPAAQARVGTLTGGVVTRLPVVVGEAVTEQQEVARIRTPGGTTEVLTAPWAGTIMAVPVQQGDTVLAGAVIAAVGDLSRLHVETTDLDEFLIGKVYRGQLVTVTIDALDGRQWQGYVRSITLQPQRDDSSTDEHYPVIIDLVGPTADLRPGMSARISFAGAGG